MKKKKKKMMTTSKTAAETPVVSVSSPHLRFGVDRKKYNFPYYCVIVYPKICQITDRHKIIVSAGF